MIIAEHFHANNVSDSTANDGALSLVKCGFLDDSVLTSRSKQNLPYTNGNDKQKEAALQCSDV